MAVVDDHVRLGLLVWNDPQTPDTVTDDLLEEYGALEVTVPKQTKAKKWVSDPFGKEDSAHASGYVRKGITHASNDDVLEDSRVASKR